MDLGCRLAVPLSRTLPVLTSAGRSPLGALDWVSRVAGTFTLKKLECSKQAARLNNVAWNNGIGPRFYFVGFRNSEVMIKRDGRGHSYYGVRGEILGSP